MSSKYWSKRQEQYSDNLIKEETELQKKLDKMYAAESKKLDNEIAAYYSKYGKDNVIEYRNLLEQLPQDERSKLYQDMDSFFKDYPQLEHLMPLRESAYKLDRLEAIKYNIIKQQANLGSQEAQLVGEHLTNVATEAYNDNIKALGRFTGTNEQMMKELANQKWLNDKNFTDRIWDSKARVVDFLYNDFRDGVIRGDSYAKMGKVLQERFTKQSSFNIRRLIYTEGTFVNGQALGRSFEDAGYKSYFYDAVLDDRTTEICEGLHGEHFDFADKISGVNFPPMHPFCRSSFQVDLKSRAEDLEVLYEDLDEAYESVNLRGIDKAFKREIEDRLLDLQNKYPINRDIDVVTRNSKQYIGAFENGMKVRNRKDGTYVEYVTNLIVNKTDHKNRETIDAIQKRQAKGRGKVYHNALATIDHEFGHAIDNHYKLLMEPRFKTIIEKYRTAAKPRPSDIPDINELNRYMAGHDNTLSSYVYEEMRESYGLSKYEMERKVKEELGDYAITNNKEFFAEGFAQYRHQPEVDQSEFTKRFGEIFERRFKEICK